MSKKGYRSFLADAAIDGSSERYLPAAVFSTARRACDVASDTPCRAPSCVSRPKPRHRRRARPAFAAASSKATTSTNQGAFPRRVLPTPPLAQWDHEEPATVLTASPPRAGFRRPFAPCARSRDSSADEARPDASASGQTPLVDFCNQTNPRARPLVRLNPDQRHRELPPGCARPVEPKPTDAVDQVAPPVIVRPSLATRPSMRATPAEVSRARGWEDLASQRLSPRLLAKRALPQPDRLGHLLSWSSWRRWLERPRAPDLPSLGRWSATSPPWRGRVSSLAMTRLGDLLAQGSCCRRCRFRSAGRRGWAAFADTTRGRGPPHVILREEERAPLHPRCLPSMGYPAGVGVIHSLFPTCGLCPGAFAILAFARRP